jgi:cell division septal protein FtsQ
MPNLGDDEGGPRHVVDLRLTDGMRVSWRSVAAPNQSESSPA